MDKITGNLTSGGTMTGSIGTVLGKDGDSAYEIAVKKGFKGTENEWLDSLKGEPGNQVSPAIKGKTSASNTSGDTYVGLTIEDVSPLGHTISIKYANKYGFDSSGIGVTVRGKNLATLEQGSLYINGGEEADRQDRVRTQYIPVVEGHTYTLSSEDNKWEIFDGIVYDEDYNYLRNGVYPDLSETGTFKIPIGIGAAYLRLVLQPVKYPASEYVPSSDGSIAVFAPMDWPHENIVEEEWVKFTPFAEDSSTSYSMMWDWDNLYLAIKTQDTTVDKGAWGSAEGQLGIFLNYSDRLYFNAALVSEEQKVTNPNAVCLVYYGNGSNGFTLGRQTYGNAVTPVAQAGDNYKFVMSKDKNGYIQFFIKMNWKGFFGIENPMKKGYAICFGAMYGNHQKRSYKTPYNGPTYTYSAYTRHFLSDITAYDEEIPEGVPTIKPNYAWFMMEDGDMPTEYEPYKEPATYYVDENNKLDLCSFHPTMVVESKYMYEGTTATCEYNRDATKVIEKLTQAIIALGGNV